MCIVILAVGREKLRSLLGNYRLGDVQQFLESVRGFTKKAVGALNKMKTDHTTAME